MRRGAHATQRSSSCRKFRPAPYKGADGYVNFSLGTMAHGSDGGVDVVRNVRPDHVMPTGADPDNTEGFARWVNSIHPAFIQDGLADKLVEEGYDRVSMAAGITVDVLRNQFAVKTGHAVAFVAAAKAVQVTLGYDEEAAEVVDPMRGGRNELPTLPGESSTSTSDPSR